MTANMVNEIRKAFLRISASYVANYTIFDTTAPQLVPSKTCQAQETVEIPISQTNQSKNPVQKSLQVIYPQVGKIELEAKKT
jgi:hypothetical protein